MRPAAHAPVLLRPGDKVVVRGSELRCAVSTASATTSPRTILCGKGDVQSPAPGTYVLAFADAAALVIRSSSKRQPQLVVQKTQPGTSLTTKESTRASGKTFTVNPDTLLVLGGTDVVCDVTTESGAPALTCGLFAGGKGTFIVGSYVGVLSDKVALLSQLLAGNKVKTVFSHAQPGS